MSTPDPGHECFLPFPLFFPPSLFLLFSFRLFLPLLLFGFYFWGLVRSCLLSVIRIVEKRKSRQGHKMVCSLDIRAFVRVLSSFACSSSFLPTRDSQAILNTCHSFYFLVFSLREISWPKSLATIMTGPSFLDENVLGCSGHPRHEPGTEGKNETRNGSTKKTQQLSARPGILFFSWERYMTARVTQGDEAVKK